MLSAFSSENTNEVGYVSVSLKKIYSSVTHAAKYIASSKQRCRRNAIEIIDHVNIEFAIS